MKNPTLLLIMSALFGIQPAFAQDQAIENLRQTGKAFSAVARKVAPSVAFIQVEGPDEERLDNREGWPFQDDLFRRFFGDDFPGLSRRAPRKPKRSLGQGSGFAFAQKGGVTYVLTNQHVVENAERIRVSFPDGRVHDAKLKGADPKSDVAVLELAGPGPTPLQWADSEKLEVGEWVVALGNPFGLSHTLTTGVVSAKGRSSLGINDYEDFIQTDAAINPGNSGGPLLNLDGEVVGMNTAIFSRSGGYMGVGFAIPSNLARTMAEQLLVNGRVVRGYIGLAVQPLTPDIAEALKLKDTRGVLVNQVNEGSPAEGAGLKAGDVLVAMDGMPLDDGGQYRNRAALAKPGSKAVLEVIRDGRHLDLPVQVGTLDEDDPEQVTRLLGVVLRSLEPTESRRLGIGRGLLVTALEPGSLGERAGITPGSVILEANRQPLATPRDLARILADADDSVVLRIADNGRSRYVTLRWR